VNWRLAHLYQLVAGLLQQLETDPLALELVRNIAGVYIALAVLLRQALQPGNFPAHLAVHAAQKLPAQGEQV
jgi:hypothetical protein